MSSAQLLLRRLLEQSGGADESGYLLVLDGEGLENPPDQIATPRGTYSVHRVGTEIGLRHLLWQARGAPLIAVMSDELARRIQKAPDLLRRARNQRVHALSVNDVLEVVLGVRVIGAEAPYLQDLALEYVDRLGLELSHRTLPTVVDRKLLSELLLDVAVGEQVRTGRPAQLLAAWLKELPAWAPNVSQLVRESLPTLHGDEGRLLAWALEEPEMRLRDLVVHGALLTVEAEELPQAAWGPLWKAAALPPLQMDRRILRRTLARLADETLVTLGDASGKLLDEADRVGRSCLLPDQLQTSRILPLAFADRCHRLARQAAEGKAISAADVAWLTDHRAARMHRSDLAVLEALARVTRYLDQPSVLSDDILEQVQAYLRDGAFADLAMLQLRRALAGSAHYHAEAQQTLASARERRDRQNRRFAETLARGYEAALHREGLTPLHRLWKWTVSELWQRSPEERLFLVVLDGCSYPVFLELLQALAQDSTFPLGIAADAEGRVAGMPALALLPSVTSHSRGAIFLGEIPRDPLVAETVFRDQEEARTDRARFNQNASLGSRSRQLFLKGDLSDGGQALLSALKNDSIQVVAAVFNAVDDQIGSSNTGATPRLGPEDIAAFKPGLRTALLAGRKVLVTADHGHSPFVDKSLRSGAGKAPRYVSLGPHDPVPEGFLEIDLAALGGPPERRAFAWKSGAYLGMPQVGYHGGCGLEELVVPLAWLEKEGLQADEPTWWFGSGGLVAASAAARPVQPPIDTPLPSDEIKPKEPEQLTLFNPGQRADELGLPEPILAKLSAEERSVLVLLKENGSARVSELARSLQKSPGRLNGLMRTLRRTLHSAGLVLFADEVLPSGETMYRYQATISDGPKEHVDAAKS